MGELRVTTLSDGETSLREATIGDFSKSLRGELLRPGDHRYHSARRVWNGIIDRKPALIVRCSGVADIINFINFSRTNNLLTAVRGGGHGFAGKAVCEGGLMLDLSGMKSIRVNPARLVARAEPGVLWGEFDHETQTFGLATTGGQISDTGIAGLTLGGGIGWLARNYGLTCDNLLSVDIVTADGRLLTASKEENPELFWGLRGGGGNFGVVTSFEYQLHHVGSVLGGVLAYPLPNAKEVLQFYSEYASGVTDALTTTATLGTSPDGLSLLAIGACYSGPVDSGEETLMPLRNFGQPLADLISPMAYKDLQRILDYAVPPGRRYYMKSNFINDLSPGAISTLIEYFEIVPSPRTVIIILQLRGAISRVNREATAFSHRDAGYIFTIISQWTNRKEDEKNIQWTHQFWQAMQPFVSAGVYMNELGDEGEERVMAAYGPSTYKRLTVLKNKYDPANFFRLNQNIKP